MKIFSLTFALLATAASAQQLRGSVESGDKQQGQGGGAWPGTYGRGMSSYLPTNP